MPQLTDVSPPSAPIYRIARSSQEPFEPPPWRFARADGTFGNRFDDPRGAHGLPEHERFRSLYCASDRAGAFGEVLANLRPSISLLRSLATMIDPAHVRELNAPCDPDFPEHRLITSAWRLNRCVGSARVAPHIRFVDVSDAATLQVFRTAMVEEVSRLGHADIDLSTVTSAQRTFTQACARYVFEQGYGGIRYVSRLDAAWECWAVFDKHATFIDRAPSEAIEHDDPDLVAVARLFGFTLEGPAGRLVRPWLEKA